MSECTGHKDCELHPHIGTDHPTKPVEIKTGNHTVILDYSGEWEATEAQWEHFKNLMPPNWEAEMREAINGDDY